MRLSFCNFRITISIPWIVGWLLTRLVMCHGKQMTSKEATMILAKILEGYDKRVVPSKDGEPTKVDVQLYIGDMVPVEHIHMHYSIDLYMREIWTDYRLSFHKFNLSSDQESIALNAQFIDDIWSPDIYFPMGKKGKLHDISRPNTMVRLGKNGTIFHSQRISTTAYCPMDLKNFPFDKQECEFVLECYSYNQDQIRLDWIYSSGGPVIRPTDLRMFEFSLAKLDLKQRTTDYGFAGLYDQLVVIFHFKRNVDYYILQNYLPCFLIVVLSWVSFWIDYRSTPARVSLGITTVLTMATLSNSIRATLPPTTYSKSIDYYLLICFLFVFAALVEYAAVGITDIKWRKLFKKEKRETVKQEEKTSSKDQVKPQLGERLRFANTIFSNLNKAPSANNQPKETSISLEGIQNSRPKGKDENDNDNSNRASLSQRKNSVTSENSSKLDFSLFEARPQRKASLLKPIMTVPEIKETTIEDTNTDGTVIGKTEEKTGSALLRSNTSAYDISARRLSDNSVTSPNARTSRFDVKRLSLGGSTAPKRPISFQQLAQAARNANATTKQSGGWQETLKMLRSNKVADLLAEKHRSASEIHVIDRISRYAFPIGFLLFNILYFSLCLVFMG